MLIWNAIHKHLLTILFLESKCISCPRRSEIDPNRTMRFRGRQGFRRRTSIRIVLPFRHGLVDCWCKGILQLLCWARPKVYSPQSAMKQKAKKSTKAGIGGAVLRIYTTVMHPFNKASNMTAESLAKYQTNRSISPEADRPEVFYNPIN